MEVEVLGVSILLRDTLTGFMGAARSQHGVLSVTGRPVGHLTALQLDFNKD